MTRAIAPLVALVVVARGGACSSPGATDGASTDSSAVAPTFREQVDEILASGPSDLEREVLADYRITDDEYARARDAAKECLVAKGYDVRLPPQGGLDTGDPQDRSDDEQRADVDGCSRGTTMYVEMLYGQLRDNPDGIPVEQALEDCVTRHDVAAAQGMSGAELAERIRQDQAFLSDTVAGTACRTNPWAAARAGTPEELDRIVTTGH